MSVPYSSFAVTGGHSRLRACMVCSVVRPYQKFLQEGCPNCEEFLELEGQSDSITDCTSEVFEGLVTVNDPKASWVAKWQRIDSYVPGTYAVKVVGELPEEVVSTMESQGVTYIPRDGSEVQELA